MNPDVKIAADVNFITVNFGSEAAEAGVIDSKSLDGVMHVTGMASGTLLHSTVTNMPYCLIIVEVPKGHMEGIHSVVSRNLVSGTLVLIVGSACDVLGVLDGLRKLHDNEGLTTICVACFIQGSHTAVLDGIHCAMDCFQKSAAQEGIAASCCYLLPSTTVTLCAPLNPKVHLEPDPYEAKCALRRVNCGKLSGTR